jgi:AcrR family transcriptional regulator
MAKKSEKSDTKGRILDAAELLFAEHGYDGVSVRNITDSAGVRLGLLAYHFVTKENVFIAVVARRIEELNHMRIEALDRLLDTPPVTVRGLVEAFIHPYLELASQGDEGWSAYTRLIAQISHNEKHMPLLKQYLDPVAKRYLDAFSTCFPSAPRATIVRGFVFSLAAMVGVFARPSRIESLSDGAISNELKELYPALIDFAVAGINGVCAGK